MHRTWIFMILGGYLVSYATPPCHKPRRGSIAPRKVIATNSPYKKIFVFDLHGVITDTDWFRATGIGILTAPFTLPKALYYLFWKYSLIGHILKGNTIKTYPSKALVDIFATAAACQTLRPSVVQAIEHLEKQAHTLCLFSNITPAALAILRKHHPDFFELFDHIVTTGPGTCPPWLSKKHAALYQICDTTIRKNTIPEQGTSIVFFDNKKANCDKGRELGWHAVEVISAQQCADAIANLDTVILPHTTATS